MLSALQILAIVIGVLIALGLIIAVCRLFKCNACKDDNDDVEAEEYVDTNANGVPVKVVKEGDRTTMTVVEEKPAEPVERIVYFNNKTYRVTVEDGKETWVEVKDCPTGIENCPVTVEKENAAREASWAEIQNWMSAQEEKKYDPTAEQLAKARADNHEQACADKMLKGLNCLFKVHPDEAATILADYIKADPENAKKLAEDPEFVKLFKETEVAQRKKELADPYHKKVDEVADATIEGELDEQRKKEQELADKEICKAFCPNKTEEEKTEE